MRREMNFGNTIAEILRKSKREDRGERNDVMEVGERKKKFRLWYC